MEQANNSDVLFSVPEAAKRLGGISPWTVHAWLAKGKLRRTKVGSRTMIRESELRKIIRDEPLSLPILEWQSELSGIFEPP